MGNDIKQARKQIFEQIKSKFARSVVQEKIDILTKGQLFGEVAALTHLKRTCSIITNETCLFQSLDKPQLQKIK